MKRERVSDAAVKVAIQHLDFLEERRAAQAARVRTLSLRWADGQGLRAVPRIEAIRRAVGA